MQYFLSTSLLILVGAGTRIWILKNILLLCSIVWNNPRQSSGVFWQTNKSSTFPCKSTFFDHIFMILCFENILSVTLLQKRLCLPVDKFNKFSLLCYCYMKLSLRLALLAPSLFLFWDAFGLFIERTGKYLISLLFT